VRTTGAQQRKDATADGAAGGTRGHRQDRPITKQLAVLLAHADPSSVTGRASSVCKLQSVCVQIISAENLVGYSEAAKCQAIAKVFDDAYKVTTSCI
jgi:hypothetical protein